MCRYGAHSGITSLMVSGVSAQGQKPWKHEWLPIETVEGQSVCTCGHRKARKTQREGPEDLRKLTERVGRERGGGPFIYARSHQGHFQDTKNLLF